MAVRFFSTKALSHAQFISTQPLLNQFVCLAMRDGKKLLLQNELNKALLIIKQNTSASRCTAISNQSFANHSTANQSSIANQQSATHDPTVTSA